MIFFRKIPDLIHCISVVAGNEFEAVNIASFSAPPELPEVMKSAEEVSTTEVASVE